MTRPTFIQGDARALPLAAESVDLIVTSPPYFGLRDYGVTDQIGAEATPAEYLAALIACTREWIRVLKPSGSILVNLGDKYAGSPSGPQGQTGDRATRTQAATYGEARRRQRAMTVGAPNKSLMLLPERYRIAAVDELCLIARAVIVWSKVNGLPESVTDRVRRSHEDWVHLTKQPKYFSAVDEIRESYAPGTAARYVQGYKRNGWTSAGQQATPSIPIGVDDLTTNPLGKLPGSVWEIATQPLRVPAELDVDHYAAFPPAWPRRLILGWSPREVCTACSDGRRPVTDVRRTSNDALRPVYGAGNHGKGASTLGPRGVEATITGYVCACPDATAPSTPGVVLDPFGGTGTTALVAAMLGRRGISVELSGKYQPLAEWRAADIKQQMRANGSPPETIAKVRTAAFGQFNILDTP